MTPEVQIDAVSGHLSEEQIADLLAGEAVPAAMKHLTGCPRCREEMAELDQVMLDFNQASLGWAETEAARRIHPPSRYALRWQALPGWGAAVAAAVLAAAVLLGSHVGSPGTRFHSSAPGRSLAAATPAAHTHSSTELAADNQLLQQIDSAVDQGYDSPVTASELSLHASSRRSRSVDN